MVRAGTGLSLVFSLLSIACGPNVLPDDDGGTEGDSSGDSPTSTTASTTASTTTASTTVGTTDGTSTTTTTTTGPAPGCAEDYATGCQSYCAATLTCDPGPDGAYEECVTACVSELADLDAPCQVGLCEAFACFGALDCATLDAGSPECEALFEAVDECVVGDDCFVGKSSDGECAYGCSGAVERDLRCNVEICVCFENDVQTETCPSNGVCEDLDAIDDVAKSCCGW